MTSQLKNGPCFIMHCRDIYEENSIVNSVRVDDWATVLLIIAGNGFSPAKIKLAILALL